MLDLLGRSTGIIQAVIPAPSLENGPELFIYSALLCDTSYLGPEKAVQRAAGIGRTKEDAQVRCMGEATEHYASALYDPAELVFARDPGGEVIRPEHLFPFSEEQRRTPGFPFAHSGPLRWVRGKDLGTGADRWAPAFAVYLPYTPVEGEAVYAPCLSTGLAAGPTLERAREAALLEVIERDAFTNWWMSGGPARRVGDAVDLTNDLGVPVASVLLERDVVSVGVAAATTFEEAVEKARMEAELGQVYVQMMVRRSPAPEHVVNFTDHARYYTDHPSDRSALDVYRKGPSGDPVRGKVDPAQALLEKGFKPWWRDLTLPDIRKAGVYVAKALVPGLTPLHSWEALPFLGAPRMKRHNPFPHPLG